MATPPSTSSRKFIGKSKLAVRYDDVTVRTIDRWLEAKILPPPDLVRNGRPFWDEARLDEHDRRTVAVGAKKRTSTQSAL